jgi:hypothetical protein
VAKATPWPWPWRLALTQRIELVLADGSPSLQPHMALHPAVAFGAVIAGGLLYGAIGAFLPCPRPRSSRRPIDLPHQP